ncbi:hypothetical protein Tco_1129842 [Tanacetum coccineum]
MRKMCSTPGFSLLKEFILLFSRNYLIEALKLSKSLKFLKSRWRFFLALMEKTSVSWMFRVSISIPLDKLKIAWIFEASRARGFCPLFTRASNPQLHFRESDIQTLSNNVYLKAYLINGLGFA